MNINPPIKIRAKVNFAVNNKFLNFTDALELSLIKLKLKIVTRRWYSDDEFYLAASTSKEEVTPGDKNDSGISLKLYDTPEGIEVVFYSINSVTPGLGSKMVDACMKVLIKYKDRLYKVGGIPIIRVHHDWSGGFWEKMQSKYTEFNWNLT